MVAACAHTDKECKNCGEKGHLQKMCPKLKKNEEHLNSALIKCLNCIN